MKIDQKSIGLFTKASKEILGYKKFLASKGSSKLKIKNTSDFSKIPITSKGEYITKYPWKERAWVGNAPLMVYASSGSSGTPTYWYSGEFSERRDGKIHKKIFEEIFKIDKKERTLVIICFSMGLWIAGTYTMLASRYASIKGSSVTTITPGLEKENIFSALKDIAPEFDTVILAGYPPFIMDIIVETKKRKTSLPKKLKILTAGDKTTEEWRDSIQKILDSRLSSSDIINIYGSADAAMLGYETPLSIFIRKTALQDKDLYKEIFAERIITPGLFQYNTKDVFFEEINGELVITQNAATPLIRYNIHDTGNIFSNKEMGRILQKYGYLKEAKKYGIDNKWSLPFVTVTGRTDVAVTYYAFNIYPEHIQVGLRKKYVLPFVTQSYLAYTKEIAGSKHERFYIEVELKKMTNATQEIQELIYTSIITNLSKANIEFAKLHKDIGNSILPKILLVKYGSLRLKVEKDKLKTMAYISGRKPKMLKAAK